MSKIRDFVVALPKACGVPNGLAEIFGELNGKLFDFELANPDGPLNRKNFDHAFARINVGVAPWEALASNMDAVDHAENLLAIASMSHDLNKGIQPDYGQESFDELVAATRKAEQNPSVSAVSSLMTVDQAVLGNWA